RNNWLQLSFTELRSLSRLQECILFYSFFSPQNWVLFSNHTRLFFCWRSQMHSLVFLSMSHPPGFSPQPLIAARAAKSGRESGGSPDGFPLFFLCEGSVD
ncbi:hypothetical protein, partial [Faecalibaculum rodentium]